MELVRIAALRKLGVLGGAPDLVGVEPQAVGELGEVLALADDIGSHQVSREGRVSRSAVFFHRATRIVVHHRPPPAPTAGSGLVPRRPLDVKYTENAGEMAPEAIRVGPLAAS